MAKSVGQWVGTIVGAVVGFFIPGGYVMLGAAIGGMIGGAIDPPKGPHIEGPRLSDLSAQTATYGAVKPRAYGTIAVFGNVFWIEGDKLKEVTTTDEQEGGKGGGGGAEITKYSYYATFAVGLCKGPILGIRRLWIGDELVYSAVNEADALASGATAQEAMESAVAVMSQYVGDGMGGGASIPEFRWKLYNGTENQLPNARMQADKGVANVSAYPGESYLVLEDMNLEKWSNTLMRAQVKAEIVVSGAGVNSSYQTDDLFQGDLGDPVWGDAIRILGTDFDATGMDYVTYQKANWDGHPRYINFGRKEFPYSNKSSSDDIWSVEDGWGYAWNFLNICQSDAKVAISLQNQYSGYTDVKARFYYPGSQTTWPVYFSDSRFLFSDHNNCVIDRGEYFLSGYNGGPKYIISIGSIPGVLKSTASTWQVAWLGASENYVWALLDSSPAGQQKVAKFNRSDLSHVATYTQTVTYNDAGRMFVLDDSTIYTTTTHSTVGTYVQKWVGGVVVQTFTTGFHYAAPPNDRAIYDFAIGADEPLYAYWMPDLAGGEQTYKIMVTGQVIDDTPAKLRDIVTAECAIAGLDAADIDLAALTNSDVRGYKISAIAAARSGFDPLQAAFPFDVYQAGYTVKFVSRGAASVATLTETELGAASGNKNDVPLLTVDREMDSQLPCRVSVLFQNKDREYDNDEQYVERLNVNSVNERRMEMAMVLTPTEAVRVADVLLRKDWIERVTFSGVSLPPTRKNLEPTDVVTIQHRSATYDARLTRVEYRPDGSLEASAVSTGSAAYTSTAVGADSGVTVPILVPLRGLSDVYLLDIPRIRSEQDVAGMSYGMTGIASGWPGAALFRSDDQGSTYQTIGSTNTRIKVFAATESLSAHHGYSIDNGSVLTLTPRHSGHYLSGVTEDQLYSSANLAAYGDDGRWEIVAFKTVTDNTGSYTVQDFLRGLYGTEWASGLHVAGDHLIMLDTSTVAFFGLPTNAIGIPRLYRAVTQGASVDSAPELEYTYDAVNIKPLSPVDIAGGRDPNTKDWSIVARRRSRWPVELFSGAVVPLGETSESWVFDIYDSSFSTLIRTLISSDGTFSYSSALQAADFGGNQPTIYYKTRMMSSVVGDGFESQGSIYRFVSDDPYGDFLVWGLHFNGTNGSTTLADIRGNTFTANGNTQITTSVSKFDGASLILDGTSDYVSFSGSLLAVGSNDFTIDGFLRLSATGAIQVIFDTRGTTNDYGCAMNCQVNASDKIVFYASSGNAGVPTGWDVILTSTATLTAGPQYHIEVVRSGSTWYLFVDGATPNTGTWAGTVGTPATTAYLGTGCISPGTLAYYLNGYLDDWRFTLAARDISAFVPRTAAFPDS